MIEIKDLYKKFANKVVFEGLNLKVHKGETLGIIGQSGCGKSVLLKHIMGLLAPDSGVVFVNGLDISKVSMQELYELRKKFGMVFQGGALFDSLTVAENVFFSLDEHTDLSLQEKYKIAEQELNRVGLYDVLDKSPSELSGGMKKRVAIARALAIKPDVLLYDEPTTGLDPITADSINEIIKELSSNTDVTAIVVTHDMASVYKVADRIAMIYNGRVLYEGTPQDIRETQEPLVRKFVTGSSG